MTMSRALVFWSRVHALPLAPLASGDRERFALLRRASDRDRFSSARRLAALAVGQLSGAAEASWSVRCPACGTSAHGPLSVSLASRQPVGVSLSHSGDRVLVGVVSGSADIGVDVEKLTASRDLEVATAVLGPDERAKFQSEPEGHPARCLERWWTRKEAVLKATRVGLASDPRDVAVTPPGEPPRLLSWDGGPVDADEARCWDLDVGPGYAATACLIGSTGPVLVQELDVGTGGASERQDQFGVVRPRTHGTGR